MTDQRGPITRQFHRCYHCKQDRGSAAAATQCEQAHERERDAQKKNES